MTTAIFLQSRLDSSRLPCKALLDLGGKPLIVRVMEGLHELEVDRRVLVCDIASAPVLQPFASACGWLLIAGSRDDVLSRFLKAADELVVDVIVRATGDNPLVEVAAAQDCLSALIAQSLDHCRMDGLPYGAGVEVVRTAALRKVSQSQPDTFEREHVCPGVWRYPDRFRLGVLQANERQHHPDHRVTLDTFEDLARLADYFEGLGSRRPSLEDYLRKAILHVAH